MYPAELCLANIRMGFGSEALIAITRLALQYGGWNCILGSSGVGKTSLLRALAGLLPRGQAQWQAQKPLPPASYLAQQDALFPWRTALDNTLLGIHLRGARPSPQQRQQAIALLQSCGLSGYTHHYPAQLSGGMRQRVMLARTLLEDRPLAIMDEPFASLDAITRDHLQALSFSMLQGKTVVLVTHDPFEALRLGHRLFLLRGRPAQIHEIALPDQPPLRRLDQQPIGAFYQRIMEQLRS